ncbi:MAG: MotA/TolQ/ExbB proton channel family protein [Flavobacteriales bacterium]|nr:MotA/TolQ/ExbB proton channel family protein [Flavobacteriales bacterium]
MQDQIESFETAEALNAGSVLLEDQPVEKTLSIMDLLFSGGLGANIIMIVLLLLLFGALYVYFERLFAIQAASKIDTNFMNQIRDNIVEGRINAAKILCQQIDSPVARMTEKGISRIGKPLEDINTAIENAGKLEIYKLEKNISMLATISGAGPMIGFLGTVIGMILAFHEMASAGGQVEVGALSEGIYIAMTTTVVGLVVGVIAYMGYNHLVVKTNKVVNQMESSAVEFLDLLNEPT